MELHAVIKSHRKYSGLTQKDFADKVGCSQKHINLIENGKVTPNWKMLTRILNVLELDFEIKKKIYV